MASKHGVVEELRRQGPVTLAKKTALRSVLNRVLLPVSPRLGMAAWDAWRGYKRWSQGWRSRIDPERYTDADPLKTVAVSPAEIDLRFDHSVKHRTPLPASRYSRYFGKVYGGDWDRKTVPIEERRKYVSMRQVYEEGYDWSETEQYRFWLERRPREEVRRRCERIDRLKESLAEHGYVPQRDLVRDDGARFLLREPVVNVGRDGELIHFRDGNHRLCLAKLLGLDRIVVRIGVRHADWQAVRDAVAEAGVGATDADPDHPDLRDLRDPATAAPPSGGGPPERDGSSGAGPRV